MKNIGVILLATLLMFFQGCQKPLTAGETKEILETVVIQDFHLHESTIPHAIQTLQDLIDKSSKRKIDVTVRYYQDGDATYPNPENAYISMNLPKTTLLDICEFYTALAPIRYRIEGNKIVFFAAVDAANPTKIEPDR